MTEPGIPSIVASGGPIVRHRDSHYQVVTSDATSPLGRVAITLLGPDIEHRESLQEMLDERASRVYWLPDSVHFNKMRGVQPRHRLGRLWDKFRRTSDPAFQQRVVKPIADTDCRIVIAYWGTTPLPDLAAIKKSRPDVKIVLMLLCHPLALTAAGIYQQNYFMRRAARFLDGFIYPSEEMAGYFLKHVLTRHAPPGVVIPPCWPARIQAMTRVAQSQDVPNLIYVGRTDYSHNTIHGADDIRPLMRELLNSGVELHHVHSRETDDGHPRRKTFRPLSLSGMVQMTGSFDASLVAYNTDVCAREDRFLLTVPDRLITSVAAGVPVAIPKKGYSAAKAYLKEYPALIEFDSANSLAHVLADRALIASLRNAAWGARQKYVAASHGASLQRFLEQLI